MCTHTHTYTHTASSALPYTHSVSHVHTHTHIQIIALTLSRTLKPMDKRYPMFQAQRLHSFCLVCVCVCVCVCSYTLPRCQVLARILCSWALFRGYPQLRIQRQCGYWYVTDTHTHTHLYSLQCWYAALDVFLCLHHVRRLVYVWGPCVCVCVCVNTAEQRFCDVL